MARYTLLQQSRPDDEGQYERLTYYHDSTTRLDGVTIEPGQPRSRPTVSADPSVKLGEYCRGTELTEVYHSAAQDGSSRLVFTANSAVCPAVPTTGGGPTTPTPTTTTTAPLNDPDAPVGAILLKRIWLVATPDGFRYRDQYYLPDTRTVITINSSQLFEERGLAYTRPTTDIIDRWCVAKGDPPYTEIRVTYDGVSAVNQTPVDNVNTCSYAPCTLSLVLGATAQAGATGRGLAELLPLGANGDVRLTLGSPNNPFRADFTYDNLPVGRYTAYARELRTGGCKAELAFRITTSYGLRYRMPYRDFDNVPCEVQFSFRGYSGPVEELLGQSNAADLSYPAGSGAHVVDNALRGSALDIRVWITEESQLLDTYSADERYVRVQVVRNGIPGWRGWLLPEQYDVAHLSPPNEFNLRATDGLGALAAVDFTDAAGNLLSGQWTALQVILFCLGRLDMDLPIRILDTLYPAGASLSESPYTQFSVDVAGYRNDKNEPFSCEQVLRKLLDSRGVRIYQDYDSACWRLERLADLQVEAMQYLAYDAEGARLPNPAPEVRLYTISTPPPNETGGPWWQGGNQRSSLRPPVGKVTVKAEPGTLVNLLGDAVRLGEDDFDAAGFPLGWLGTAPTSRLAPAKKSDLPALLLIGPEPASTLGSTRGLFIETPPSLAVPSPAVPINPLRVSFTATLRALGPMPNDIAFVALPRLYVAVRQGTTWLGASASGTSETQVLDAPITFEKDGQTIEVELTAYGRAGLTPAPVVVRFYQVLHPTGQPPYNVELKNIRLTWAAGPGREEDYQDTILSEANVLYTREDAALTLFHTDTPGARLHGTLLGPDGLPTEQWSEASDPQVLQQLPVYVVRDRLTWQSAPARVLLGLLRGRLNPGYLLTDPQELNPKVYLLTETTLSENDATTDVTAVELNTLRAPALVDTTPDYALLTESGRPILSEDAAFLLAEYAN